MPRGFVTAFALGALALACAAPAPSGGVQAPREIQSGAAESAIQRVEADVSPEEVERAVRAMVATAPVCMSWPALWLEPGARRTVFIARFDYMARDWGAEIADSARVRMEEFVGLGFLTRRVQRGMPEGAVEYTLTDAGERAMQGWPTSGRASFCAPAERRLIAVTATEFGQFGCGNLRVSFTHVSDDWPSWAREEATRARLAATWPPIGEPAEGSVTLSRYWSVERARASAPAYNSELRSICYDMQAQRVIGDDLTLFAASE